MHVADCHPTLSVVITMLIINFYIILGQLYAIGGYDGQERLNTVEVFDLQKKKWKLVAPMLCKRR